MKVRGRCRLETSIKSVASVQMKRGFQPSSTFYLSNFSLVALFQANWSNLETTDDENDLNEVLTMIPLNPQNYCLHSTYCAQCEHKNKVVKSKRNLRPDR